MREREIEREREIKRERANEVSMMMTINDKSTISEIHVMCKKLNYEIKMR